MPTIEITLRGSSATARLTATIDQPDMLALREAINAVPQGAHRPCDSMATLIAPYGSEAALAVARNLDAKITNLLEMAAQWSNPRRD